MKHTLARIGMEKIEGIINLLKIQFQTKQVGTWIVGIYIVAGFAIFTHAL
jgi:hypothetical protein